MLTSSAFRPGDFKKAGVDPRFFDGAADREYAGMGGGGAYNNMLERLQAEQAARQMRAAAKKQHNDARRRERERRQAERQSRVGQRDELRNALMAGPSRPMQSLGPAATPANALAMAASTMQRPQGDPSQYRDYGMAPQPMPQMPQQNALTGGPMAAAPMMGQPAGNYAQGGQINPMIGRRFAGLSFGG